MEEPLLVPLAVLCGNLLDPPFFGLEPCPLPFLSRFHPREISGIFVWLARVLSSWDSWTSCFVSRTWTKKYKELTRTRWHSRRPRKPQKKEHVKCSLLLSVASEVCW